MPRDRESALELVDALIDDVTRHTSDLAETLGQDLRILEELHSIRTDLVGMAQDVRGASDEETMRRNVADLKDVLLRQVVMRDVSVREQAVEVLGQQLKMPVILAPVGLGGMMAARAEVQAARAAERAGVPFIESTVSICPIEEVAGATPTPSWLQPYVMRDRAYAEALSARAQRVGP